MAKQIGTRGLGDNWSRQKVLCYDVRHYVIEALGCIELL